MSVEKPADPSQEESSGYSGSGPRRWGREMALQLLYQYDLAGGGAETLLGAFDLSAFRSETAVGADASGTEEGMEYARRLFVGTLEKLGEIDPMISEQAENWRLERMPVVDRNVLRLAVFELVFENDVPKVVIVNEAIELAKKFGSEHSGAFVNGLLDSLIHQRDLPGAMH